MSIIPRYQEQIQHIREIGDCLKDGEFVESPFDVTIEEERRGDPDKRDDDQNFPATENICISLETELPDGKKQIGSHPYTPKLFYFLDGSLRTKYLGEYIERNRCFPVLASETTAAVVKKVQRSAEPHRIAKKLSVIFPHKETGIISDTTFERLKSLDGSLEHQQSSIRIEFLKTIKADVRYSMLGKARDIMHTLEHDIAQSLQREEKEWLVMDGAIRKAEFLGLENTIGLAKSFSRKPLFDLGDENPLMITTYLSRVRDGERSAVFKKESGETQNVAFWYVRIRTYPPMEPLGGLVKIDFRLDEDELSNENLRLIDEISAEVYAFRSPSVYPHPRWPAFIYPIRLTELMMKSTYINKEMIGYYGRELKRMIQEGE